MTWLRGYSTSPDRWGVTDDETAAHDAAVIKAWNDTVAPGDTVWHLGDFSLINPTRDRYLSCVSSLNGHIRLISGNHDFVHPMNRKTTFSSFKHTAELFDWVGTQARVILHDGSWNRPVLLNHFSYSLEEYPNATKQPERCEPWLPPDTGLWLLHGHTHTKQWNSEHPRAIHVGWDTWGRPVAEQEIVELIRQREAHG